MRFVRLRIESGSDITYPVLISFPPLIGHTTLVTLCGFAYGMKGFFIASTASLLGATFVFTTLRLLFSQKLRQWSTRNEKWQALESVVVCLTTVTNSVILTSTSQEGQRPAVDHPNSHISLTALGVLQYPVCSEWRFTKYSSTTH